MSALMLTIILISYNGVSSGRAHGEHSELVSNPLSHMERRDEQNVRSTISKRIQLYMNTTVDPCDDFYAYACGNWRQHQENPLTENELRTAQDDMDFQIEQQLQQILTKSLPAQIQSHMDSFRKVRDFYNSCLNANSAERHKFFMKIVQEHGGLRIIPNSGWQRNYHWVQMLAALRRSYGLDILIGVDVDLNLQQMQGSSIYFGEPQLTIIPSQYCNAMSTQTANVRDDIYEQIQQQVVANMRDWFSIEEGEAARFAGDIVSFEFELCKHMREEQTIQDDGNSLQETNRNRNRVGKERLRQKAGSNFYPRMTIIEMSRSFGIDFKLFVEYIVEATYPEFVYLRSSSYLTHLVRTTKSYNKYTITGYILYRALLELNYPTQEPRSSRSRKCVQLLKRVFPTPLGEMYQREVRQDNAEHDLKQIFSDIIKAFEQQLSSVDWLDEHDRRTIRSKLSHYHAILPDYESADLNELRFQKSDDFWRKYEMVLQYNAKQQFNRLRGSDFNRKSDAVDAFEVRAEVILQQNAVVVGWGLLQQSYYSYYYPKALKYALVAQRVAQALLQAFDDDGWNNQPFATSQWNELTMSGYRNISECYRTQYSNYLYDQPHEFRNATKLRELVADSSAFNIAFNAYINWLEAIDHNLKVVLAKETLSDLNLTNTQLFFVFFAQSRCWVRQDELPPLKYNPMAQHTSNRWAVNGPLSNSEEFSREFGCGVGKHMNLGEKCVLY